MQVEHCDVEGLVLLNERECHCAGRGFLRNHAPLLRKDLQDLQDVVGLEDKDIAQVKQQILAEKEAKHQHQQGTQRQEQEEYNNKLQQYELEFSKAVEREYPLSKHARDQINSWQQSLGLRAEDIKRIEQPILATKYQEKLKEEERQKQKKQKAERAKQLELQKQREQEEYQQRLEERLKREEEERLRPQQQENIPSQIISSKKAREGLAG